MSKLQLIKADEAYRPNWNDPRIQSKLETVLKWCAEKMTFKDGFLCNSETLTKTFGPRSSDFANHLRQRLLIQYGHYVPGVHPYTYRINEEQYRSLVLQLEGDLSPSDFTADHFRTKYNDELSGTKPFQYVDKADRYWHPLINIRRELKAAVFKGFLDFDYDISAAAPTILFQLVQQLHPNEDWSQKLPTIYYYTQHKQDVRETVAADTGIDILLVKKLINGVFNGIRLVPHSECSAYRELDYDALLLKRFKEHQHVKGLSREAKRLWIWIRPMYGIRRHQMGLDPIKSSGIYFHEERRVMNAVRDYLDAHHVHYLLEHDGVRTDREIDVLSLSEFVLDKTGYKLKFD